MTKKIAVALCVMVLAVPTFGKPVREPIRPVPTQRFIDRGDYVEDTKTGLLWQKDGKAAGKHNFFQAGEYAKNLKLGGMTGWRVPKIHEFKEIFPATDAPFTNTPYNPGKCCGGPIPHDSYWTSELQGPNYAFVYHWYAQGGANNCYADANVVHVRCVHDPVRR